MQGNFFVGLNIEPPHRDQFTYIVHVTVYQRPPPPTRFKALQVQSCTERCTCLPVNYDADICYAVFAFISKKRGGGVCEYPGPFVVTNCGTLGAREEMGGGGLKKCTVM